MIKLIFFFLLINLLIQNNKLIICKVYKLILKSVKYIYIIEIKKYFIVIEKKNFSFIK